MPRIEVPGFGDLTPEFTPAPVGRYTLRVESAVPVKAASSGEPMLKVVLKIAEGECAGKAVFQNIMLTDDGEEGMMRKNLKRWIEYSGCPSDDAGFDSENLVGCLVDADLNIEEYQGNQKNVIKRIYPVE